jgi:RNA polymerase-interacting CarD/CdnL/TRCF family regulator
VLENAKTMLTSELAVVQGTSLQEAAEQLENVITENID